MVDIGKLLRKRRLTKKESLVILMVDFIKRKEETFNLIKHYENVTAEQLNKKYTDYLTAFYENDDYISKKRYEYEETLKYYNLYYFTNDLLSQAVETSKNLQTNILYLNSVLDTLAILESQKQFNVVDKRISEHTINNIVDIHNDIIPFINYEIVRGYKFIHGYNSFIKALSDFTKVNELEQIMYKFDTLENLPTENSNYFTVANIGNIHESIKMLETLELTDATKNILNKFNIDLSEFRHGNINQVKYNYVYNELENADFLDEWRHTKELLNKLEM